MIRQAAGVALDMGLDGLATTVCLTILVPGPTTLSRPTMSKFLDLGSVDKASGEIMNTCSENGI